MCWCDPNIRTPTCGRIECRPPLEALASDVQAIDDLLLSARQSGVLVNRVITETVGSDYPVTIVTGFAFDLPFRVP